MYAFLLVIHLLAAILLVVAILIQRGRGGGLVQSLSGVESMFGTKTSAFLTRMTAIFATIFLFTSISLAVLSARQSRSLIDEKAVSSMKEEVTEKEQPVESELPPE
jgi:preprotein translocase subunit SecG